MERVVTLEEALELVKQLSPVDKARLIERIVPDIEREFEGGPTCPAQIVVGPVRGSGAGAIGRGD